MGLGDFLDDIGDAIEKGVEDGIEGLGQLADSTLDALGDGADAIGLDSLGEGLDDLGDDIASATGGEVDERELGETDDPKELIRGEPAEIGSTAETLRKMAAAIDSTGQALRKIDAAEWVGQGADAFNEVYDKQPKLWFDGADAMTAAADAMNAWHNEVKTAQAKAADAIEQWKAADAEERRQKTWWNSLSGEQQAQTPLVDTWTSMRNAARDVLRGARNQRDNGASIAVSAFAAATEKAPKEPPFTERWIANLSDLGGVLEHGRLNFMAGLYTSLTGLVQFVRRVNPTDIYNLTHPAEYAAGLSDLGTGLVVAVADPGATVSAILSDARRNPFEFAGALTGDLLVTVATGGGGSAKLGVSALKRVADAGRVARLADDAGGLGRRLPDNPAPGTHGSNPPESTHNPSNSPARHDAGPAPRAGGHTPGTNPMDAGSRPDSPAPRGDHTGSGNSSSATPEQHSPSRPEDGRTGDQPSSSAETPHHSPDPAPRAEPDSAPTAHGDPDPAPPNHADPAPATTPRAEPDPTPAPHSDPGPPPAPRTDPDPPQTPRADPDPPETRTDPRPEAAQPTAHADPAPSARPDAGNTPTAHADPEPTARADPDPPQTRTDPRPEAAQPTAHADPAPSARPDAGNTPPTHVDREPTPATRVDPGSTPATRADPDPAPAQGKDVDRAPVTRTDGEIPAPRTSPDATSHANPDHATPTHTDPTPPVPGHLTPLSHAEASPPLSRPHPDPAQSTRAPDPANQTRTPGSAPTTRTPGSAPTLRIPDPTHQTRTPEGTPTARAHDDPAMRTRPDPASNVRAAPHSSPATRAHPQPIPDHTPTRVADTPTTRADADGPGHRPDPRPDHGPDGRRPDDGVSPRPRSEPDRGPDARTPKDNAGPRPDNHPGFASTRTPDHDPDKTPGPGDRPPRDPLDPPTDRRPHDRDHDPDNPTAHDHAAADRNAHDHARSSGVEADRTPDQKTCSTDPVDISTGEFLLPEVDFDLPGVLPLTLRRAHHSNYRFGRWFGPSWSATLDVRLVVEDVGVTFLGEDGIMLAYPHAEVGVPVHPVTEGQQWSLTRTETGGYRVWDQRRERIWHFTAEPGMNGLDARLGNYAISAITDRHHNRVRFHYDTDGVPIEVSHSGGYRVRVATDHGRVTGLSLVTDDPDVGELAVPMWKFVYSAGDLVAVTDSVGATVRYTYDPDHRMTSWTDTNGNQMVNTYDESGRVVHQRGTAGILNSDFDYLHFPDGAGRLTSVTDSLGATTRHGFDRELQLRDLIDPADGHTHIDYNADRRPLTVTAPDGATTGYRYTDAGDLSKMTRPDGNSIDIVYVWRNRPATITGPDGAVTRREWSSDGNLSAVIDPDDNRTEFTYHPNGALATITESNGARTTVQVDAAGLPIEVEDPLGAVTHIHRDSAGRPIRVTDALGAVTRYDWSPTGKLLRRTDPDGHTESWTYDGEGNTRTHTDRAGGITRFTYGAFDLLHSRTEPDGSVTRYTWDTERRLTAVHNPIGQTWTYEYDRAGRLIAETDYTGATTRYTHDLAGRVVTVTPATGVTRHHRHDILGRLTEIIADTEEWIRYTYDPAGRVLQAVNGSGADPTHALEFAYTATGQIAFERLDTQPPMVYEHDPRGNRVRRITPSGAVTSWHHDIASRIDLVSADDQDVTFDYDPLGRLTSWRVGEIAVTRDLTTTGRVTRQEVTAFPARALHLDLNSSSRRAPRQLRRDEFDYRPDGYLTAHTTIHPGSTLYPGAADGNVAAERAERWAGPHAEVRLQRNYDLDAIGRVTTLAHNDTVAERYSYDPLSNITSAELLTDAHPETYDNAPEDRAPDSPWHNPSREYRNNLLIRDGRTRYRYDASGRLIRKTTTRLSRKPDIWHYRYNAFDQLTDVWTPDHQWWHYTYDALGRRTTKQHLETDGTVLERTDYIWDGTRLIEQATSATTTRWEYRPGSRAPITQTTDQEDVDREFYAIITDLVGTPVELVDPGSADTVATTTTNLWGKAVWRGTASTPLRFPGQIHDPETDLHYNLHRVYDPTTGRYLTQDPLGIAAAPNPSSYPLNPTVWSDPLGLVPDGCIPWSDRRVADAARQLESGATSVRVASRADAEELFLRLFQGDGYRNAGGFSGPGSKRFFDGLEGTYHWDDEIDPKNGSLLRHGPINTDGKYRHLQVHTLRESLWRAGVVRIFWGDELPLARDSIRPEPDQLPPWIRK
ncbi:putative T7SS-secreted protein [Nocardia gipuzkoensis]